MSDLHFNKLNNYFKDAKIVITTFLEKQPNESIVQFKYRIKLNDMLIDSYKFFPKSAAIVSTLIRDQYFLGIKFQLDNELDSLIKDLISNLKNNKVTKE